MLSRDQIVFLTGLPGVGKTTVGRQLALQLGHDFLDIDEQIVKSLGKTIAQLFEEVGQYQFRRIEQQILIDVLTEIRRPTIIATGGGLPCFFDNHSLMCRVGTVLYLYDDLDQIAARLAVKQSERPMLAHLQSTEIARWLLMLLSARHWYYRKADLFVHVDKALAEIDRILAL